MGKTFTSSFVGDKQIKTQASKLATVSSHRDVTNVKSTKLMRNVNKC